MNAHQRATRFILRFIERFGDGDFSKQAADHREALEREITNAKQPKPAPPPAPTHETELQPQSTVKPEDENKETK